MSAARNADMVEIRHPDRPGVTSRISRGAFERRSRKLGWVEVDGSAVVGDKGPELIVDPTGVGGMGLLADAVAEREALVAEAKALGLKVHHRAKPDTIRRQIAEAKAAQ